MQGVLIICNFQIIYENGNLSIRHQGNLLCYYPEVTNWENKD